jgi:hypothetical protein
MLTTLAATDDRPEWAHWAQGRLKLFKGKADR